MQIYDYFIENKCNVGRSDDADGVEEGGVVGGFLFEGEGIGA